MKRLEFQGFSIAMCASLRLPGGEKYGKVGTGKYLVREVFQSRWNTCGRKTNFGHWWTLVDQRPRPQISSAHPGWKSQGCETNIAFKLVKVIHLHLKSEFAKFRSKCWLCWTVAGWASRISSMEHLRLPWKWVKNGSKLEQGIRKISIMSRHFMMVEIMLKSC